MKCKKYSSKVCDRERRDKERFTGKGPKMIAVVKKKYVGIKTIDGNRLLMGAKRVLDRLNVEDRAMIEKILSETVEFVDNPIFHTASGKADLEKSFEFIDPEIAKSEARLLPIDIFEQGDKVLGAFKPLKNAFNALKKSR